MDDVRGMLGALEDELHRMPVSDREFIETMLYYTEEGNSDSISWDDTEKIRELYERWV